MLRIARVLAIAVCSTVSVAHAQTDWPAKTIRFLLPFAPGGAGDVLARLTGQRLQETLNAQAVVEPRPGAGGIVATEVGAKATPDGYTFVIVTVGHAVNPSLYDKLPYDTVRDFTGAGMVAMSPSVLTVHPSVPARTVKDIIALGRARPGELNYGTGGNGTTAHVSTAMFASMTGVQMVHVPYKGAPLAIQDLLAGRLDLVIDQVAGSINFIKSGKLRAIAVTPAKRTPQLPDEPTIAEAGVPGYEFTAWWLFVAPAKTPHEIIERFNRELQKAAADPVFRERLARFGADPAPPMSSADVDAFIQSEIKRWAKVVKDAGIKAQ
jgi:tripartite-type tricarboxylate transporter receptor subunit TctC